MIVVGQGLMNIILINLFLINVKMNDEILIYELSEGYLYVMVNMNKFIFLVVFVEGVLEIQIFIILVLILVLLMFVEINFDLDLVLRLEVQVYVDEFELVEKIVVQFVNNLLYIFY